MTAQPLPCLLLAAGRGERMRPLSDHTPKPLLKIKDKSLLSWHLESLQQAGVQNVVINHAWLGEQIETTLGNGHDFGLSIQYSPEVTALETAGGICQALPILKPADFFLVINGDVFSPHFPIQGLIQRAEQLRDQEQFLAHLILVPNSPHHPTGDFYLDRSVVLGEENLNKNLPRLTFSGIGIYHRRLFDGLIRGESAKLAPILRRAMLNHQISGEKYLGSWHDVGSPERLAELNRS